MLNCEPPTDAPTEAERSAGPVGGVWFAGRVIPRGVPGLARTARQRLGSERRAGSMKWLLSNIRSR